jgi:RNA polymerase sigma factor (sigma-70 family)
MDDSMDTDEVEKCLSKFARKLAQRANSLIGPRLRPTLSGEDAAISAIGSFWRGWTEKRYRFKHTGALWKLLVRIMTNKIRRQGKRHQPGRLTMEPAVNDPQQGGNADAEELLAAILKGLPPRCGQIVHLLQKDCTIQEIADHLGCSRWTVRRNREEIKRRLRSRWKDLMGDDSLPVAGQVTRMGGRSTGLRRTWKSALRERTSPSRTICCPRSGRKSTLQSGSEERHDSSYR